METRQHVEVLGIDLVRFLAASSVVVWHFAGKPFLSPQTSTLKPLMPTAAASIPPGADLSWFGWIGVQVFFVISGAVIAWSADRNTGTGFFIGRVARLWPAMIICATICSALALVFWQIPVATVGRRYLLSLVFYPFGPWYSGQVWTLPIEIVFYAVIWLLIVSGRLRQLQAVAAVLACLSLAYWVATGLLGVVLPSSRLLPLLLVLHGCYFATGMVLAKGTVEGFTPSRLIVLAACAAAAMIEISVRSAEELRGSIFAYDARVPCLVWLAATAFIWASMAWRYEIAARFRRQVPLFKLLGALTYPFYLVHYQTGGPVFAALYHRGWPVWAALVPAYLVALAVAFVIARWAEPVLRNTIKARLQSLLSKRSPVAAEGG